MERWDQVHNGQFAYDLSVHYQDALDSMIDLIDNRPRQMLGWDFSYRALPRFMTAIAEKNSATIHRASTSGATLPLRDHLSDDARTSLSTANGYENFISDRVQYVLVCFVIEPRQFKRAAQKYWY